jgi:hypothetical protein
MGGEVNTVLKNMQKSPAAFFCYRNRVLRIFRHPGRRIFVGGGVKQPKTGLGPRMDKVWR